MRAKLFGITGVLAVALLGIGQKCQAGIINSGSGATLRYGYHSGVGGGLDENTLHYWSLDEAGTSFEDGGASAHLIPMASQTSTNSIPSVLFAAGGVTNNARRIATGATTANRITAFSNTDNTLADNLSLPQANSFFGTDGAITVDLLIRPDFGPSDTISTVMRIISQENDESNPANLFLAYDARSNESGHLIEFHVGGATVKMEVPAMGDNALVSGNWYHFAVTYNGDEQGMDNVKFYWTKVTGVNDATTAANLVSTATLFADPITLVDRPEFTFGNETNGGINKSFFGAMDEIRISGIDRDPTGSGAGFIFVPEPSSIFLVGMSFLGFGVFHIKKRK